MKTALFITYHWPPAGGPGVQRVLKFTKYLREYHWNPIILTVSAGEYAAMDESLLEEVADDIKVFKTSSIEPFSIYKKFVGIKKDQNIPTAVLAEKNHNWRKRSANWIRMNFFIPDAKIGWMPFAISAGKKIIQKYQPDIIFSSSPPPTVHLIAKYLKKWSGLNWIADFRDPWTDIHYYENHARLKFSERVDKKLELSVLKSADLVSCISRLDIENDFSKKISVDKCLNFPNGYDENDFKHISFAIPSSDTFLMMHLGAVGRERIPVNLFKAIQKLQTEGIIQPQKFNLTFVGNIEPDIKHIASRYSIFEYLHFTGYLPHLEALKKTESANAMLLLITQSKLNKRILPGKTFEYIRSGKPILALGPEDGEVSRILKETRSGKTISYENERGIYKALRELIEKKIPNQKTSQSISADISFYSRQNQTALLTRAFDKLTG